LLAVRAVEQSGQDLRCGVRAHGEVDAVPVPGQVCLQLQRHVRMLGEGPVQLTEIRLAPGRRIEVVARIVGIDVRIQFRVASQLLHHGMPMDPQQLGTRGMRIPGHPEQRLRLGILRLQLHPCHDGPPRQHHVAGCRLHAGCRRPADQVPGISGARAGTVSSGINGSDGWNCPGVAGAAPFFHGSR
jgi:hypothetical protein